jgi:hypothetical protein
MPVVYIPTFVTSAPGRSPAFAMPEAIRPPVVDEPPRRSRVRRWIVLAIIIFVIGLALYGAVEPYDERGYVGIPHGDHSHYVPRDRDPNVSISNFPTSPPGPNERIMPDGRVVQID